MDELLNTDLFDSLNLTGQSQPSLPPSSPDLSLDDQILNDVLLDSESFISPRLSEDDAIRNALIDIRPPPIINLPFEPYSPTEGSMADFTVENLDSPTNREITRQSTIEESIESINLSQSQTDYLLASSNITTGRAPIEHSIIDNSILATRCVRRQAKIYRNASKNHRQTDYQRASTTVAPFNTHSNVPSHHQQASASVQMQSDYYWTSNLSIDSEKIQILGQPRERFRPRTQTESENASHYIRCAVSSSFEYPTISIPKRWADLSNENIIEVALVKSNHQLHRYSISNKTAKSEYQPNAMIFRQNGTNTLYFRLTENDFNLGFKNFHLEFIKGRQEGVITKKLIQEEQLEQSKLRFTRIYLDKQNNFQRDELTTEYSSLMIEAYTDVGVEHFGPRYGSKIGENVYILMKGHILKDDLIIEVNESTSGLFDRPTFSKTGNLILFKMPNVQQIIDDEVNVDVKIFYKSEQLYQTNYIYTTVVEDVLSRLRIDETPKNIPTDRSSNNVFNFFAATGACPTIRKYANEKKQPKRLNKKK